jgi:protocatechuate 3,4-dioxygenase beta subunit
MHNDRRQALKRLAGLSLAATAPGLVNASALTPRQSAGPFYPPELPLDDDNDLVHVAGRDQAAKGKITDLSGRLLDHNGEPLKEVRIEIWQCDANGRYRHPLDPGRRSIDPGFQGFGHTLTDGAGRYRFLTIKPVPYPGRTPHIHVAVYPMGDRPFVTQLYVAGEPRNSEDFLYNRVPVEVRHLVTSKFARSTLPYCDFKADWDVILDLSKA